MQITHRQMTEGNIDLPEEIISRLGEENKKVNFPGSLLPCLLTVQSKGRTFQQGEKGANHSVEINLFISQKQKI